MVGPSGSHPVHYRLCRIHDGLPYVPRALRRLPRDCGSDARYASHWSTSPGGTPPGSLLSGRRLPGAALPLGARFAGRALLAWPAGSSGLPCDGLPACAGTLGGRLSGASALPGGRLSGSSTLFCRGLSRAAPLLRRALAGAGFSGSTLGLRPCSAFSSALPCGRLLLRRHAVTPVGKGGTAVG